MMKKILVYLEQFCSLDEGTTNWLYKNVERIECRKNTKLLDEGGICNHVWFIETGLIRDYEILPNGKESCNWFMKENDIATAVGSFFTGTPTRDVVETVEDCVLWTVSRKVLFDGFLDHPRLAILTQTMIVKYYCQVYKWASILRRKAQEEMYDHLAQHDQQLLQRVSEKDMASFMGVSQPTYDIIKSDHWRLKSKKQ